MIFFTSSTKQLEKTFRDELGEYQLIIFNDHEIFLKLISQIKKDEEVTVVTATNPPASNLLELFFLLNTLQNAHAKINLIFTYFGYARQDHPQAFVAQGAKVICNCLKQFSLNKTIIIHPHSKHLHQFISFTSYIPYELYIPIIEEKNIEVIVAPDQGAHDACKKLSTLTNTSLCTLNKKRIGIDQIKTISLDGSVTNKNVLILDDLISTGSTIINAAENLKQHHASKIYSAATHSLLTQEHAEKILKSPIQELWVTNTIKQTILIPHYHIINIGPALKNLISMA
jgi:ribose-phosphate pyrophosphokinase